MERQDGKASDHGIFFVAGIFVLGLLGFFASRSPVVLHRIELPLLRIQAKIYSCCPTGEGHAMELLRIENILAIVDREVGRTGNYGRISTKALGKAMTAASERTKRTTRILSCALVCALGSLVAIRSVRVRRRLHDNRENVRFSRRKGVEGFLQVAGRYLEPDMAVRLGSAPTPEKLADAFGVVRAKVNMPCSVVARLFERGTRERMALLQYGKVRVTFADEETDGGIRRNKIEKEI
ncbi:MAG TPA: hypothetical protein PKJ17_08545 [Syntrophorhabdaceae bacterium]|nr:hypothetical protein [Syntrophorhabdaceae bacterium]